MDKYPPVRRRSSPLPDQYNGYSTCQNPRTFKASNRMYYADEGYTAPKHTADAKVPKLELIDSLDSLDKNSILLGLIRLEKRQKTLVEHLRAELGLNSSLSVQSYDRIPGNAANSFHHAISSSLWEDIQRCDGPIVFSLCYLIEKDIELAFRKKLPGRLWQIFHRELEAVQQALKMTSKLSQNGELLRVDRAIPQRNPDALRALLYSMIGQAEHHLTNLSAVIEQQMITSVEAGSSTQKNVLQCVLTYLGDLARYKQLHRPIGEPRDWSTAEELYHRSFRLRPLSDALLSLATIKPEIGKPWNQLALVAVLRKDNFAAFYYYLRSLCAAEEPCPARESLLSLHERFKKHLASLVEKGNVGMLPLSEHTHRFLVRLLVSCGACLARLDLSDFNKHLSSARLHLIMSLQLQLGSQAKDDCKDPQSASNLSAARRRLPAHLTRVALITICTADACYENFRERNSSEASHWTDDDATMNALCVIFSLVAALAGATAAAGFGSSAQDWKHATLPALCIFLDWLQCCSNYGTELKNKLPETFNSTMSVLAGLCSAMVFVPSAPADTPLLEDVECQGLISVSQAVSRRLGGRADPALDAAQSMKKINPTLVRISRVREFAEWASEQGWLERVENRNGSFADAIIYAAPGAEGSLQEDSSSYVEEDFECESNDSTNSTNDGNNRSSEQLDLNSNESEEKEDGSPEEIDDEGLAHKISSMQTRYDLFSVGSENHDGELNLKSKFIPSNLPDLTSFVLDESPEALAVRAALADLDIVSSNDNTSAYKVEEELLPENLLGMVMAGLGDPDERLCPTCCNTLGPKDTMGSFCPYCGSVEIGLQNSVEPIKIEEPHIKPKVQSSDALFNDERMTPKNTNLGTEKAVLGGILTNVNMADVNATYSRPVPTGPSFREVEKPKKNGKSSSQRNAKPVNAAKGLPHLVVLDAPNLAMRHGLGKKFSSKGIRIAADHYRAAGHRVVGFIPEHHLDERRNLDPTEISLLQGMVDEGILVPTPSQDYDDSYCITYCMQHNGCVLTNDRYRDHYAALDSKKRDIARRWVKGHIISFTFVGDEFLPNPDFEFIG